jgi:hypothetical protein
MSCMSSSRVFSQSSQDGAVQFIPVRCSLTVWIHVCAFSTGNATISRRDGRGRGSGRCRRYKLKLPCRDATETHYFVVVCNWFYKPRGKHTIIVYSIDSLETSGELYYMIFVIHFPKFSRTRRMTHLKTIEESK